MSDPLTILTGDALQMLKTLPDECVQCCVTSPPYWGLRNYGCTGQMGLEKTPEAFVSGMVAVFEEVRRVLKSDGTCWVNMGDSYAGYHGNSKVPDGEAPSNKPGYIENMRESTANRNGLKPKDLCGIPWRLAFGLQAAGWYLRQDIVWAKPNPMPESVTDRCTKSHEYIFLLSKSQRYYFNNLAIQEIGSMESESRYERALKGYSPPGQSAHSGIMAPRPNASKKERGHSRAHQGFKDKWDQMEKEEQCAGMRNKRSVWTVATSPYREAHFATFPPKLIKPCIRAGSRLEDVVLDPFAGSGTTGSVSLELGRKALLIELNPEYVKLIKKRCNEFQLHLLNL